MAGPTPPRSCLLFADSFHHDRLCQHVDEVRFTEPVIITACEVVELHQPSLCPTLDLKGTTSPESCALEFYVRSGRDSRFQRLGPAFLHSPAATSCLDVQAAVTEHMVLRGSYKSLSLVIYGNLARELGVENKLDSSDLFLTAISKRDPLGEVLLENPPRILTLSNLHLLTPPTVEQGNLLERLLKCVGGVDAAHHLVSMLLTAAAAWHLSSQRQSRGAQWSAAKKIDPLDGSRSILRGDSVQELLELHNLVQQKEDESKHTHANDGNGEMLVNLSQLWLKVGLEPSAGLNSSLSAVESLVGGLASVQLLCSSCPKDVPAFLAAGGMRLLDQVVEEVSGTTALLLFALTSLECLLRYRSACEAFSPQGKKFLLTLLENKQHPPVTSVLHQILQRLHCYELAVAFGQLVKLLTNTGAVEDAVTISEAIRLLNDLLISLSIKNFAERFSAEPNWGKQDLALLTSCASGHDEFASLSQDVDFALLLVLQETSLLASLAAFLSVSYIWPATRSAPNVCIEFALAAQRLLLRLLECRSGLLFLNGDTNSFMTLVSGLKNASEQELEVVPIRHVVMLSSMGYLCTPQSIAEMLQSRMSMVTAVDRFVGADRGSEAAFRGLWDLANMSRSEAGRQAILAIVSFPEVLTTLIEAIHPSSESAVGGAAGHFAAEVLQKVFCDSALANQIALTTHASALQTALQAACNIGMSTCSKLVEWVEAAVVYRNKGAVGLLKHAAALIGPQNTSTAVHADGSMDDDANNLRDRAPGSELPNSSGKGLGPAVIQDSAIHALTISLRILASAGWNLEVAALLFGDGAMSVVNAILEHCLTALQVSSNEYDDEEVEEDEGRGEDLHNEQALLALLLPTLLLLLSLLRCLQGIVQQYCSTRLLDLLIQLHHVTSAKSGAHGIVPPFSWRGGVLELGAVQQVLASLLAFWPVLSWTPALLPRVLGPNSTSMEPGEACSVICMLEGFLPPERPRLNMDKAAVADVCRLVSVGTVHGMEVMSAVLWHTSPYNMEIMVHALHPHMEQIGQLVVRFVPCNCEAFQDKLANLVIRLACQSPESAAVLVRPVLLLLEQRTAASANSLLGETDILQVTHMLRWVTLLAAHPSSKAVLLHEGAVRMLLQILSLEVTSGVAATNLDWFVCSFRVVALLCDTSVSFSPSASVDRRMSEDCPNFSECCAITSSLLRHCQITHLEPQTEVLADALEKLASHDVGRAALASVALGHAGCASPTINQDTSESRVSLAFDKDSPPLLKLWQNFALAMRSVELKAVHLRLVQRFAQIASAITDSGRSSVGGVALKALFGLDVSSESMELKMFGEQDDKLEALSRVVSILEQQIIEIGSDIVSSCETKSSLQEALSTVLSMLEFLNAPAKGIILHDEIESFLSRLPAARPIAERRAEAVAAQTSSCFGLISSLIFAEGANPMDVDRGNSNDGIRGTVPWDCPKPLHEKPVLTTRALKRRVISTVEVASKRDRGDGTVSAVASRTTVVVTSTRRDTFRQRKPNTSRPPSMHVDDYVAREKSSEALPGSSPATSTTQLLRSNSGTERAPSIHVDEFMARQREHQQSATTSIVQGYVENGVKRAGLHVPERAYDGADLSMTDGNSRIMQPSIEYSSVNIAVSSVASFPAASPALGLMNSSGINAELGKAPETVQRQVSCLSASEPFASASQRAEQVNTVENSGAESNIQPPPPVVKVKLERVSSTNSASAGSPSPFLPSEHGSNNLGTPSVKKESRQQSDRNFPSRTSHVEAPAVSNFSSLLNAPPQQAPHSDVVSHLTPPPPASPSPWLDASRRLDPPLLPPTMPRLMPAMNALPYNHGLGARPPADLQVGGVVLQPPAGLWRDSSTVFSGLPPPGHPIPGPIQHGPLYVQQPFMGASRPLDTLQGYPASHASTSSTIGPRFANFGCPSLGQGASSQFQPPVPSGIPPSQSAQQPEQPVNRPLSLQDTDITSQQEPGAVLQQILQSPDTIQELLKDPKKLQELLEQHPKLITLLQEKMSYGTL